jgi:hypothetical protein
MLVLDVTVRQGLYVSIERRHGWHAFTKTQSYRTQSYRTQATEPEGDNDAAVCAFPAKLTTPSAAIIIVC